MSEHYERESAVAVHAVREAARLCRAVAGNISPDVLAKKDKSPVTVADFGSQALICRALAECFPGDPVIAEEDSVELRHAESTRLLDQVVAYVRAIRSQTAGGSDVAIDEEHVCRWIDHGGGREFSDRFWTLDPIDGTKGFLRGEQYAVALALIVGGRVAVAALACPNLSSHGQVPRLPGSEPGGGTVIHAVRERGTWAAADDDLAPIDSAPVRLAVSQRSDPGEVRFCESVESGHSAHGDAAVIAARLGITAEPLRMDSQAKYAVVARGEADIYLRLPTRADYQEKIWDHAAGALIVTEAGGVVTDIAGKPLEFHHGRELTANRGVIVTNGHLHSRVIEAVRASGIKLD